MLAAAPARAQNATWLATPSSGNFNAPANWDPATVPTGTASFAASNISSLSFSANTTVGGFTFDPGASAYTFTNGQTLVFNGAGIIINGGSAAITNNNNLNFLQSSTAGSATITNNSVLVFTDTSTAGSATVTTANGALTRIDANATGGQARFITEAGGTFNIANAVGPVTVGSIEGAGTHVLGGNQLTTGFNNLSTTVSGPISGAGGSLFKVGTGTLNSERREQLHRHHQCRCRHPAGWGCQCIRSPEHVLRQQRGESRSRQLRPDHRRSRRLRQCHAGFGHADHRRQQRQHDLWRRDPRQRRARQERHRHVHPERPEHLHRCDDHQCRDGAGRRCERVGAGKRIHRRAGATLDLNGFSQTVSSLAGAGNTHLGSAALTTGGNNSSTTFSGVISGAGGRLVKVGTGTMVLSRPNTYSGGTTLNAGALQLGNNSALGSGDLTVNGGTLLLNGFAPSVRSLAGSGGLIELSSNSSLTVNQTADASFGGSVTATGAAQFTKNGPATLSLNGTVDGPTGITVGGGTLVLNGANTFGGGTVINFGATARAMNNQSLGSGAIQIAGEGRLQAGAPGLTLGNAVQLGGVAGGAAIIDTQGFNLALTGSLSNPSFGGLNKQGTGTLTLFGPSSYLDATTVNQGTLQAGAANVFSPFSAFTVRAGATLDLNNFNQTIGPLAGAGNYNLGSATLSTGDDTSITTYSGVISGTGSLVKTGAGALCSGKPEHLHRRHHRHQRRHRACCPPRTWPRQPQSERAAGAQRVLSAHQLALGNRGDRCNRSGLIAGGPADHQHHFRRADRLIGGRHLREVRFGYANV